MDLQSTGAVLMVRPAHLAFNHETAASNAFQSSDLSGLASLTDGSVQAAATREFDGLANRLVRLGVRVVVAEDTPEPAKPDAIFPNNWVSFHDDGTVVLYPMQAPNRRLERRADVIQQVLTQGGFLATRTVDLTHHEAQRRFLEGTGSLVLDRSHRVAYAALSPRTHGDVLDEFARVLGYEVVTFNAADARGTPIYHTNVLMAVGSAFAVVCSEAIGDGHEREAVQGSLRASGHRVVEITLEQMQLFAGNLLELAPAAGGRVIALSSAAWSVFTAPQRRILESYGEPCVAPIPVIERLGGGSVRCMLAEIHLPGSSIAPAGSPTVPAGSPTVPVIS
jgi:hypothetical protein